MCPVLEALANLETQTVQGRTSRTQVDKIALNKGHRQHRPDCVHVLRARKRLMEMCMPGVEPGPHAWEACMIPLHDMRSGMAHCANALQVLVSCAIVKMTAVGFTPTPLRAGA